MKRFLVAVAVTVATVVGMPVAAGAAQPFRGSCSMAPTGQAGYEAVTFTGLNVLPPGHAYSASIGGPGPTNPVGFLFEPTSSIFTDVFAYSVPGTYSVAHLYEVNDKTGNGKGDESGDQYTLLPTNVCSGAAA